MDGELFSHRRSRYGVDMDGPCSLGEPVRYYEGKADSEFGFKKLPG